MPNAYSTDISASLAPPPLDEKLAVGERLKLIQSCLGKKVLCDDGGITVAYDFLQVYKTLLLACGISLGGVFEDPKVDIFLPLDITIAKLPLARCYSPM